ncbi:hypothetical protein BDZ89DRAFT_79613 [Hymenopellis radicata]|nr:hypothetical protein BDZ89DRAFT_79613 [Hymenopellis radicata]
MASEPQRYKSLFRTTFKVPYRHLQSASTTMSSSKIFLPDSFPQEIIDLIIDFVNTDQKAMRRSFALTSCAAVSRKFRARARTCLFHTVTFDSHSRTASRLCALLTDDDHLQQSVREMRFDGPKGGTTVYP